MISLYNVCIDFGRWMANRRVGDFKDTRTPAFEWLDCRDRWAMGAMYVIALVATSLVVGVLIWAVTP